MPGSRSFDLTRECTRSEAVNDGTAPRMAMPGAGSVGQSGHVGLAPQARLADARAALQQAIVDDKGVLRDDRVDARIASTIERGKMEAVRGIVVHQTDGPTAQSSLDSYKKAGANGAHFLVDKDGSIYQTASLRQRTWHVGKLKARCVVEHTCTPAEIKAYRRFDLSGMNTREQAKAVPFRYPSNADSIGIELVGKAFPVDPQKPDGEQVYEAVTDAQNVSLKWLVDELTRLLGVPMTEVFRHPDVSWKNTTEASTAKWQ